MYSYVLRAHQKVDRIAYRATANLLGEDLPITLKQILHYEGRRGPDNVRLKKESGGSPWHFYQPGKDNSEFLEIIERHHHQFKQALGEHNNERAAFEAAWLAHALVDGLTPAHHYPYEDELHDLRQANKETRASYTSHFIVKSGTSRETVRRSFQLIGPKGLLTTHTTFEAGAAMVILPLRFTQEVPSAQDIEKLETSSISEIFEQYAKEIKTLSMYERFYKRGWTQALARDVRRELAPRMIQMVTLAWYDAIRSVAK